MLCEDLGSPCRLHPFSPLFSLRSQCYHRSPHTVRKPSVTLALNWVGTKVIITVLYTVRLHRFSTENWTRMSNLSVHPRVGHFQTWWCIESASCVALRVLELCTQLLRYLPLWNSALPVS